MDQEQILNLIKEKGPVVPSQVSKDLGTNILLASAILSDLTSRNLLRLTSLKVGGSPLYYVPGQEEKLTQYLDRLHDKEKEAVIMLSEKKILRDSSLTPINRVALRQTKDFAKPLEVTIDNQKEIFWKWYMLPNEQAEPLIRKELQKPRPKTEPKIEPAPTKQEQKQEIKPDEPKQEAKAATPQTAKTDGKPKKTSSFWDTVKKYFEQKNITVTEQISKKSAEMLFMIKVPSAVGEITYCCYARDKAKCTEADLSYAYVQGQIKKMPVLYISTGELTAKAKELLASKELSNLTYAKVQ